MYTYAEALGADGRPLEGQPAEEHGERAPGRADERAAEGGRGPSRAPRDTPEDAGAGDTGRTLSHTPMHTNTQEA